MPGLLTLGNLLTYGLTAKEVLACLKVKEGAAPSREVLRLWAVTGLVKPSYLNTGKRGRWNLSLYSHNDLAELRLVMRLRREGVTMLKVKNIFAYLREKIDLALVEGSLESIVVVRSGKAYVILPGSETEIPSGQVILRFGLAQFAEGNVEALDQLRRAA